MNKEKQKERDERMKAAAIRREENRKKYGSAAKYAEARLQELLEAKAAKAAKAAESTTE